MPRKKLVVLTGAGISAESGLKTFRDSDGLWEGFKIEDVATPGAWRKDPSLVLGFYNYRREQVLKAEPNAAHYGLVSLEEFFDVFVITQNIDDLHERAGSKNVLHLHGEILKMRSENDPGLIYPITGNILMGDIAEDGRQLRPAIVWFEEAVPMIEPAIDITETANIFVVIGTSLVVYPAAGLLNYVPSQAPTYIIDKKIPYSEKNIIRIEKPATEGIVDFIRMVRDLA